MTAVPTDSYFDLARETLVGEYRDQLAAGRVVVQCCRACTTLQFPPALGCHMCGRSEFEWAAVAEARVVASAVRPDATESALVVEVEHPTGACRLVAIGPNPAPAHGETVGLVAEGDAGRWRVRAVPAVAGRT